jgi:hypothetical protein
VQLFDRRRTSTTAPPGIPTPREPARPGPGPATSIPPVSAPRAPAGEPLLRRPDGSDPEAEAAAGRSGTDGALAETDLLYVLVPGGSGFTTATVVGATTASGGAEGWMLLALRGQRQHWSTPLLSRGAAVTAPPRVAQAVAVRVLTDLGLQVRAWHNVSGADQPMYRAQLEA